MRKVKPTQTIGDCNSCDGNIFIRTDATTTAIDKLLHHQPTRCTLTLGYNNLPGSMSICRLVAIVAKVWFQGNAGVQNYFIQCADTTVHSIRTINNIYTLEWTQKQTTMAQNRISTRRFACMEVRQVNPTMYACTCVSTNIPAKALGSIPDKTKQKHLRNTYRFTYQNLYIFYL